MTKLGLLRAQLFQSGADGGEKGDHPALPKAALDRQWGPVAQPGDNPRRRIVAGLPVLRHGEIPLDGHRGKEAIPLAGKDAEDRVVLDARSGVCWSRSTSNSAGTAQRQGEETLSATIQLVIDKMGLALLAQE